MKNIIPLVFICPLLLAWAGHDQGGGQFMTSEPLPGEKFNFECEIYTYKIEEKELVAREKVVLNNNQYDFSFRGGATKYGRVIIDETASSGTREVNVDPFSLPQSDWFLFSRIANSTRYQLNIHILDEDQHPPRGTDILVSGDIHDLEIDAKLLVPIFYKSNGDTLRGTRKNGIHCNNLGGVR